MHSNGPCIKVLIGQKRHAKQTNSALGRRAAGMIGALVVTHDAKKCSGLLPGTGFSKLLIRHQL
jgi:hypothetical protein